MVARLDTRGKQVNMRLTGWAVALIAFALTPHWSAFFYRISDGGRNPKMVDGFPSKAACEEFARTEIREQRAGAAHFFCGYICFFTVDFGEPSLGEIKCMGEDPPRLQDWIG